MKDKKQIKPNIIVGTLMKDKVIETEEKTREGRVRRMRKEVLGCVQDVTGKEKFPSSISRFLEERYDFCFACVCMFERVGMH